jgi:hypothetical protein
MRKTRLSDVRCKRASPGFRSAQPWTLKKVSLIATIAGSCKNLPFVTLIRRGCPQGLTWLFVLPKGRGASVMQEGLFSRRLAMTYGEDCHPAARTRGFPARDLLLLGRRCPSDNSFPRNFS